MIISVTSWRGVGATTTALLLATAFAEDHASWLVEADPAGGVLAGRVHVDPRALGGLEHIAFAADHQSGVEAFEAVAQHVGEVRIVTAPADPFRAYACHAPRLPWAHVLHDLDGPVVVDVGRTRAGAPTWPLLSLADVVVLVTSPEIAASVASIEWLRAAGRVSPADLGLHDSTFRVAVVDQPGGVAFDRGAMAAELDASWGAWLPWEPDTVDLLHRGAALGDRRLRRSRLAAAGRELLASVRELMGVV